MDPSAQPRPAARTGRREYHPLAGEFPLPFPLDSPAETRLVRVARALQTLYTRSGRLASGWARRIARAQLCREICKLSKTDSLSDLPHYVKVKVDIVMGGEDGCGDFSGSEEMPKIGARVAAANRARALRIDRTLVFDVARVLDEHAPFASVQASMARRSRGQHAIHHVNAARNIIGNLFRPAHAHQVARPLFRQQRGNLRSHFAGDFVWLADGQAADSVPWKFEFQKLPRAFPPQIRKRRALHDSELPLCRLSILLRLLQKILPRPPRPARGALQRRFGDRSRRRRLDAFVEDHRDVGTECKLNFRRFFGREEMLRAVQVRAKAHAFIGDLPQIRQAEHLVPAG